jgi:DNA invertase Pin-like site-specific DNA recombinase
VTALEITAPKVAAIYARISRDAGHDELGVQRQVAELREFAAGRGWEVIDPAYVDNDISASKGKRRPRYERLLSDVAAGGIDVVLVTEVTRLARRMTDLAPLVDVVAKAKTTIHALRAGGMDLSTSGGQLQAHIMGAVAQHEVMQMSERIKAKLAENTRLGKASGGPRPFGYQRAGGGALMKDRGEAKLIKQWARDILAGRTVSSIVTELNATGVPTVRGGRWTGPTVNQILLSPRLIGMTASGGEPVAPADWPAILDRQTWEQVRGVLASRRRGPTPRRSLLAGVVQCGVCGTMMAGNSGGSKGVRQYICPKTRGGCGRMTVKAEAVDDYVTAMMLRTAERANLAMVRAERHVKDSQRLIAEVAEDEQLLSDLAADMGARRLSRAEWIAARGPIEARLIENRAALAAVGTGPTLPPDLVTIDRDGWEALPFDQQRAVLGLFVDRVVVRPVGQSGPRFQPDRLTVEFKT